MPNVLPDYLRPNLDLIFVGFNPSMKSAALGHYYAGPGNQFWPFLYEAQLTPIRLTPQDDHHILDHHIGLTDIVKGRATPGIHDLTDKEYTSGFDLLCQKLQHTPRVVCFNGKSGYTKIIGEKRNYGLQPERIEKALLFLAPSTSGALPMPRATKLAYYHELKTLIDRTKIENRV